MQITSILRTPALLKVGLNLWPPYLGAGIKIRKIAPDYKSIQVAMNLTWFNRNNFGTHFGGSLYSMVDPFFAIMVIKNLGPAYYVWDQSASINFLRPGKGQVFAHFAIDQNTIDVIVDKTKDGSKFCPKFMVAVLDRSNQEVARIEKTLYVRRKPAYRN